MVEKGLKRICFYTSDYGYGHAARDIALRRDAMRATLGLKEDEFLIYLGVGKSLTSGVFKRLKNLNLNSKKLLISSSVELPSRIPQEKTVRIPSTETESQDYLAIADIAVSKTGYSTVSEAIRGRVPMFLFGREGYAEDKLFSREVEELGIGHEIQFEDFADGRWVDRLDDLNEYREGFNCLSDMFKADGSSCAVDMIKEMIM